MKFRIVIVNTILFFCSLNLYAQSVTIGKHELQAISVLTVKEKIGNKEIVKVVKDPSVKEFDEPTFARLKNVSFINGVIELEMMSKLLSDAPEFARGFIGIAFRINETNDKYESIYLRPTNARANDQIRRNHTIQYYAYPDYKFDRLRKESPEKYESYSDMAMNEWIKVRIEIKDSTAKLFLNNNRQPSLIVNDLKHGIGVRGSIGLWVDIGTEGYFRNIKITQQ
ncbi:hypothetical protein [Chitinophaga defluvii]|uniref:3-keto-disaccharide hydrolase domain-containing protein n=1 Tax=Chitinophaga defluvii TaxID=3163343 RepID=A0ABV2TEK0_9BACT|nr:hypothetical protein [Bacteroidota bacterium]MBS1771284.1 hypothetical protein [Bacteroidota bacterium]